MKKIWLISITQFISSSKMQFFGIFFLINLNVLKSQEILRSNLNYGSHQVGFKFQKIQDSRRSFFPNRDFYGNKTSFETGRPLHGAVWYPTNLSNSSEKISYESYIKYFIENTGLNPTFFHIDTYIKSLNNSQEKELKKELGRPLKVYLNASQEEGDFPLVIYSPALNSTFYENSVLCELIASYGFIVVSTSSLGEYSQIQGNSVRSIEVQAEDIAFLADYGRTFTENESLATIGFSRGGLANIIYAMKQRNVDVTISLDGSIFSQGWLKDIESSIYYKPKDFESNLLMITKNFKNPENNPSTFYDSVTRSLNKSLIRYDHDDHGYFSSDVLLMQTYTSDQIDFKLNGAYQFYASMSTYVVEYLEYVLKGKGKYQKHSSPKYKHAFSFEERKHRFLDPKMVPFWIQTKGIDFVTQIFETSDFTNSEYLSQINWRSIVQIGDDFIVKGNIYEARKTLLLANKIFPNWYIIQYKLGKINEVIGDNEKAKTHYLNALNDHPRHHESRDALNKLGSQAKDYQQQYIDKSDWKKYVGQFWVDSERFKEIYIQEDKLFIRANYWAESVQLWPYATDCFLAETDNPRFNLQLLFQFDQSGNVISLKTRGLNSGRISEANIKKG